MIDRITDSAILHNGVGIPWLGLGVFRIPDDETLQNAMRWGLETGYRHFDTAAIYENEIGVGQAIRQSDVPRAELFITTKVWNSDQGYEPALRAFDASLERLDMDYVDLYLVHWPVVGKYKETWRALETIYESGRARAIGVSNFLVHHLQDLLTSAHIVPMVNQVEFHPRLQLPDLQVFCQEHDIRLQAWRPIMQGDVNQVPELVQLAETYGKTPVQITLRWMLQSGIVTIPKSVHKDRIQSNADIFDFELSAEAIALIDSLDRNERMGADPDNFNF